MKKPWCNAWDLATQSDYSCGAKLELKNPAQFNPPPVERWPIQLRDLERPKLRTSYVDIAKTIRAGFVGLGGQNFCDLVIDQSGVGRPVIDDVRAMGLPVIGITIVGGSDTCNIETLPNGRGLDITLSKMLLVSTLVVALETGRLKIAHDLPLARVLQDELRAFTARRTPTGQESAAARGGKHDDCVMSVALGVWWLSRPEPAKVKWHNWRPHRL